MKKTLWLGISGLLAVALLLGAWRFIEWSEARARREQIRQTARALYERLESHGDPSGSCSAFDSYSAAVLTGAQSLDAEQLQIVLRIGDLWGQILKARSDGSKSLQERTVDVAVANISESTLQADLAALVISLQK
jgi:type II secretory pathway pseudopilin PulG